MTPLQELEELEKKIATAQQTKAQAEGALSNIMDTLKEKHGVDSLEQAEAKRLEIETRSQQLKTEFDALMAEIRTAIAQPSAKV